MKLLVSLRVPFTLICLLLLSVDVQAQNASGNNSSNDTFVCLNPPRGCYDEIGHEALWACKEYSGWEITPAQCQFWKQYARTGCMDSCGNCTVISYEVYSACLFSMQLVVPYPVAVTECRKLEKDFLATRCPAAMIDRYSMCYNNSDYDYCNRLCGNYNHNTRIIGEFQGCNCWRDRFVAGAPDVCEGKPVLEGAVAGRQGLTHSCTLTPQQCKPHWELTMCGIFRHCPVDLCVVKDVSCPEVDSCQGVGECAPGDGKCYYTWKPDGSPCDDGLFYTHQDTCYQGTCTGIENSCQRYHTNCTTTNPCMKPTDLVEGACDPGTGSCVFENVEDGRPCASRPGYRGVIDGQCRGGLCYRDKPRLCDNVTCPPLGECYEESTCSPITGECSNVSKKELTRCDDDLVSTYNDRCIEGRCVGDLVAEASWIDLGDGLCHGKRSIGPNRYYGDQPDESDCREQCKNDPECTAYSYGYHVCSIWGTARKQHPDESVWGKVWVLTDVEAQVDYTTVCYMKSGSGSQFTLTQAQRALLIVSLISLILVPCVYGCCVSRKPCWQSCRRLMGSEVDEDPIQTCTTLKLDDDEMSNPDADAKSFVAAAPLSPDYLPLEGVWDKGRIEDGKVTYNDETVVAITYISGNTLQIEGTDIQAELGSDGRLYWTNDEVWVRVDDILDPRGEVASPAAGAVMDAPEQPE